MIPQLRAGELGRVRHKSSFVSRDELIDAVSASSDIPGITGRVRATAEMPCAADDASGILLQRWLRRYDVDGGLFDIFPDPWAHEAAQNEGSVDGGDRVAAEVAFVSPFAGTGFAIAPERHGPILAASRWPRSILPGSPSARTMDLTADNLKRWKHTFVPPDEAALREYEAEGLRAGRRWLASSGWAEMGE